MFSFRPESRLTNNITQQLTSISTRSGRRGRAVATAAAANSGLGHRQPLSWRNMENPERKMKIVINSAGQSQLT